MTTTFREFADINAANQALTEFVLQQLKSAIADRGHASLVVSGGRSPVAFFDALSHSELQWSSVNILLADERCVAESNADSNTRLLRERLLVGAARDAKFFSLGNPETTTPSTVIELGNIPSPFDVVILGMGEDGHTASIFPDSPQIDAALDPKALRGYLYAKSASAPHARLTLSAKTLTDTRVLVLPIAGQRKRAVYENALNPGAVVEFPIRLALHHSSVPCHVFWNP